MYTYVAFYLIYERNGMKGMCLIDGLHLRQYYFPCTARITTAFRALLCYRIVSKNEIKKQEQFAVMKIVLPQQSIAEIIYFCWLYKKNFATLCVCFVISKQCVVTCVHRCTDVNVFSFHEF